MDAAREVAGADVDLDLLESLLDKSLLRHRLNGVGQDRYWMLETIREYAARHLAADDEETTSTSSRRRHAEWFAAHAACVADDERAVVLGVDDDTLRAALTFATTHEPEIAVTLCPALITSGGRSPGRADRESLAGGRHGEPFVERDEGERAGLPVGRDPGGGELERGAGAEVVDADEALCVVPKGRCGRHLAPIAG